ncbi:MAG: AmmeMemoRadiSam system protein A [Candidatus Omnitrophica bacterium]|nr:AmmeMemoRadiSam system protein A [Candidatus Omnitrophota bacterium]
MPDLSSNHQKVLLALARKSVQTQLESGDTFPFETQDQELMTHRGCFVTLRLRGQLRGCVGTFFSEDALYENVRRMALAAAFQDTRFDPVTKPELKDLKIEISVLGDLEKVENFNQIEIGKHGVYVKFGTRSGTYLPEVAVEQKWLPIEFIMYCAREKAGLLPEECRQAEVFRYEVDKFKEE